MVVGFIVRKQEGSRTMVNYLGKELQGTPLKLKEVKLKSNLTDEEKHEIYFEALRNKTTSDMRYFSSKLCRTIDVRIHFGGKYYLVELLFVGGAYGDLTRIVLKGENSYKERFSLEEAQAVVESELKELAQLLTSKMKFTNLDEINLLVQSSLIQSTDKQERLKSFVTLQLKMLYRHLDNAGLFTVPDLNLYTHLGNPTCADSVEFLSKVKQDERELYKELKRDYPSVVIPEPKTIYQTDHYYFADTLARWGGVGDTYTYVGSNVINSLAYYTDLRAKLTTKHLAETSVDDLFGNE